MEVIKVFNIHKFTVMGTFNMVMSAKYGQNDQHHWVQKPTKQTTLNQRVRLRYTALADIRIVHGDTIIHFFSSRMICQKRTAKNNQLSLNSISLLAICTILYEKNSQLEFSKLVLKSQEKHHGKYLILTFTKQPLY